MIERDCYRLEKLVLGLAAILTAVLPFSVGLRETQRRGTSRVVQLLPILKLSLGKEATK